MLNFIENAFIIDRITIYIKPFFVAVDVIPVDIDLGRWLKGGYAILGQDGEAAIAANDSNPDADIAFIDGD